MKPVKGPTDPAFGRRELWAPLAGFLVTAGLVLSFSGSWANAARVILGPFAGAYARDWQSCCARWSWQLLPFAAGALALGFLVQARVAPTGRMAVIVRKLVWVLCTAAWFVAALLSYAHALE